MRARIGERNLAFEVTGQGRPLILLHAFPFDRRFWREIAPTLGRQRQVVAPDLRGFGESDRGGGGFSIADLADDVAGLMDALGLERAAVGGLSMGGYVALAFAVRHRHRLEALALCDTKAGADSPEARHARGEAIALVREGGVGAYLEKQLPRLVSANASEELKRKVRALAAQSPESVVAGLEALRDRPDRRSDLPGITCPTVIVVGTEDVLTPPTEAASMAASIPGARLVEIRGAGHLANLEAAPQFASALASGL